MIGGTAYTQTPSVNFNQSEVAPRLAPRCCFPSDPGGASRSCSLCGKMRNRKPQGSSRARTVGSY